MVRLRTLAVEATNLVSTTPDVCYPLQRVMAKLLEHLNSSNFELAEDKLNQMYKLSELVIFMFHLSIAGAARSTHSLQLKLRNEYRRFSQHSDGTRNIFILRKHMVFIHYFDKAGNSKGIEFDPSKPTILIPHVSISARLLLYFSFVLPLAVDKLSKGLSARFEKHQLTKEELEVEKLILCVKAQYPFVYLGWSPETASLKRENSEQLLEYIFGRATDAYGRCFRRCMLKCKVFSHSESEAI